MISFLVYAKLKLVKVMYKYNVAVYTVLSYSSYVPREVALFWAIQMRFGDALVFGTAAGSC